MTEDQRASVASIEEVAKTFRLVLEKRLDPNCWRTKQVFDHLDKLVTSAKDVIISHEYEKPPGACV